MIAYKSNMKMISYFHALFCCENLNLPFVQMIFCKSNVNAVKYFHALFEHAFSNDLLFQMICYILSIQKVTTDDIHEIQGLH